MVTRLERAGATPQEIEHVQANPSLLARFETVADQDIHEFLVELRKAETAVATEVETVVEDVEGKAGKKAAKTESDPAE